MGEKEEEEILGVQATDFTSASSYDLSGKGAKLGYYIIVYNYVYVLLLFLRFSNGLGF